MKVLLVILHADSARGGAESYTVRLFHKLREAGHDVFMAAATFEASIDTACRVPLAHAGLTRVGRYKAFLHSLDAHLTQASYDIVHAMLPVNRCDVYHPHAGIESVTIRSTSPISRLGNRRRARMAKIESQLLAGGTLTVCPSRRMRELIPQANAVVLYSAPDDTLFVPRDEKTSAPQSRATFVGQDFERKGLDIAIRALAMVENVSLQVVGRDDPTTFKSLAQQMGVADRIEWLGARNDVAEVLAGSDLFLLPSRHEPFGMVVVEAMLMGVPPIVSAGAGASEVVRDGVDGRIVSGEDPSAWAQAMREVIAQNPPMRQACLSRRAELSYHHHLAQLIGFYERIVAARTH